MMLTRRIVMIRNTTLAKPPDTLAKLPDTLANLPDPGNTLSRGRRRPLIAA